MTTSTPSTPAEEEGKGKEGDDELEDASCGSLRPFMRPKALTSLNSDSGIVHVASNVSENPVERQKDACRQIRVPTTSPSFLLLRLRSAVKARGSTHLAFFNPILQIASQSALDSGEAAGEVSSMYSTPNSSERKGRDSGRRSEL